MNAVVAHQEPERRTDPVVAEGATILAVISRAASDPNTDVDKMERLMGMYERIEAKRAVAAYQADLAEMQEALPSIGERGNAANRYTYALWEDINAAVKPILKRFGFALSFRTDCQKDAISVTGVLTHKDGHREETTISLPADSSGNKNAVQAVASSVSYGKRYTAGALLNLTSHGEDDDAFAAGAEPVPAKDAAWIAKAKAVTDFQSYQKLKAEMLADYGGKPDLIPMTVRTAFNVAAAETKPKD